MNLPQSESQSLSLIFVSFSLTLSLPLFWSYTPKRRGTHPQCQKDTIACWLASKQSPLRLPFDRVFLRLGAIALAEDSSSGSGGCNSSNVGLPPPTCHPIILFYLSSYWWIILCLERVMIYIMHLLLVFPFPSGRPVCIPSVDIYIPSFPVLPHF